VIIAVFFLVGLAIGSFLNVVIRVLLFILHSQSDVGWKFRTEEAADP